LGSDINGKREIATAYERSTRSEAGRFFPPPVLTLVAPSAAAPLGSSEGRALTASGLDRCLYSWRAPIAARANSESCRPAPPAQTRLDANAACTVAAPSQRTGYLRQDTSMSIRQISAFDRPVWRRLRLASGCRLDWPRWLKPLEQGFDVRITACARRLHPAPRSKAANIDS